MPQRVKLLGINLEGGLNFDFHVDTLIKKASKKFHDQNRINMHSYECFFKIPVLIFSAHIDVP